MQVISEPKELLCQTTETDRKGYYMYLHVIDDERKLWKWIKHLFSDKMATSSNFKMSTSSNFTLHDNEKIISNEKEVAEKFNSYFSNIVFGLDIKEVECINIGNDDISNPILMAIKKFSGHP